MAINNIIISTGGGTTKTYNVTVSAVMCIATSCTTLQALDKMNAKRCPRTNPSTTCRGFDTVCPNVNPQKLAGTIAGIVMAGVAGCILAGIIGYALVRGGGRKQYVRMVN